MRRLAFRLLVGASLAIAVAAIVVVSRGDRAVSPAPRGQRALPELADKLGSLAWMRLNRGPLTVNFAAINKRWTIVEKGNYPADQERVNKVLLQLAQLQLIEPKTDKPELLGRLDLDDPANGKSTMITLQDRSGVLVGQIIIGRPRPSEIGAGEPGIYIRKAGGDQAWLARGGFELAGDALSWLDRRIVDIAPAQIASVVLTAADGSTAIVARGSPDQPFALDGAAPADSRPKPDAELAAPAAAFQALDLDDVKPAAERPVAREGVATAALTTFDGLVFGLRLSPPEAGNWVAIDVTGFGRGEFEAKTLAARLSPWSFAIPPERAKLLRMTPSDFLLPRGS